MTKTVIKTKIVTLLIFFNWIMFFSQEYKTQIEENKFIERRNNKFGIVNTENKIIVPFEYEFIDFKNSKLIVRKKELNGVIDTDNKEIIPIKYQYILPRNYNRFILWTKNSEFGLADNNGIIILPVNYKNLLSSKNDDFYISENKNGYNGVFDINGKNIIPEKYKFFTIDNYKIFAEIDNKAMILDIKDLKDSIKLDENIKFKETVRHFSTGEKLYQIIEKNGKYGLINSENEIIIPIIYDNLESSQNWRYYIIEKNNKKGLISIKNEIIKEPIYDKISLRKEYMILYKKGNKDDSYSYENF